MMSPLFIKTIPKHTLFNNEHKRWTPRHLVLLYKTGVFRSVLSIFALAKMATLSLILTPIVIEVFILFGLVLKSGDWN